jgi:hypothetical protein
VLRIPLTPGLKVSSAEQIDDSVLRGAEAMLLLNVLYAPERSTLHELGQFLVRLDDLSHCLVWSKQATAAPGDQASIDSIELPRLKLKFYAKADTTEDKKTVTRLYSADYAGLCSLCLSRASAGLLDSVVCQNRLVREQSA